MSGPGLTFVRRGTSVARASNACEPNRYFALARRRCCSRAPGFMGMELRYRVAGLSSILILGPDAVAAAHPATPAQLVHACHRWGFSTVIPASWGDELIADTVLRRCSDRDARAVLQCSCPHVADRLGRHAPVLDDAVLWLVSPPVAVAKYLRSLDPQHDVHLTYAGNCPGGTDTTIDEHITA